MNDACGAGAGAPLKYPGKLPVPCQLAPAEVDFLYDVAARRYTGAGLVLDLGCFFGGSTYALAQGLEDHALPAARRARVIAYDSFVTPRGVSAQFSVPLAEGDDFLAYFGKVTAAHAERIVPRRMWIPDADQGTFDAGVVFPEREPIEILHVDCAKQWGVHRTILSVFGPHLRAGAWVLQQDFKAGLHYLPLHMYHVREYFELAADVPGSTVVFRRNGKLAGEGASFATARAAEYEGAEGRARLAREWDEAGAYYREFGSVDLDLSVKVARARHEFFAGDPGLALERLETVAAEAEAALAREANHSVPAAGTYWPEHWVANWRGAVGNLARQARAANLAERERWAALAARAWPTDLVPLRRELDRVRAALWRMVAERVRDRVEEAATGGAGRAPRVALYGAGRHTRELLATGWPHGELDVVAVLDDHGSGAVAGVEIMAPTALATDARLRELAALIPSSQEHEATLRQAALAACRAAGRTIPVLRVYAAASGESEDRRESSDVLRGWGGGGRS